FGAAFGVAVQGDGRAAAAQLHHFHFVPGYAVNAGTQSFADGLLSGETPGQAGGFAPALAHLHLGKDALEEAFPVMLIDFAHAVHLDNVDANRYIDALRLVQGRGQSGYACRAKKPVGDGDAGLTHQRGKDQGLVIIHTKAPYPRATTEACRARTRATTEACRARTRAGASPARTLLRSG